MAQRKHPRRHYVRRILEQVVRHPANADHRAAAVARALRWQATKRMHPAGHDLPYWGLTLRAYPDSASASNVVYFTERFDWEAMGFLERYLRPGDRFLDVGANIGAYALLAAALVGDAGTVDAVEPLPRALDRLRENLARNQLSQVAVHPVAVGDHDGTVDFVDFDVSSVVDHQMDRRGRAPFPVPMRRLDELVGEGGFAAGKLDVEGVELQALRGAASLVGRLDPPVWLVEVMDWQLAKHGDRADDLVAWLDGRRYAPHRWDPDEERLVAVPTSWNAYDDLIFVATDRLAEVEARLAERGDASRHR